MSCLNLFSRDHKEQGSEGSIESDPSNTKDLEEGPLVFLSHRSQILVGLNHNYYLESTLKNMTTASLY